MDADVASPPTSPRPRLVIPYVVLTVSLLITFAAAAYVAITSNAKDRARFENAVDRTQVAIQRRIQTYENLLMSGSALFSSSNAVTKAQFKMFVDRLHLAERYPGIQGVGMSYRIPPGQMEAIVKRMKAEGQKDFQVHPLDPPREEYHTIMYLEPDNPLNAAAIGFDMFSEPTRRAAMELARDTGQPATSGIVTLVQERAVDDPGKRQVGFLIYVPVYYLGGLPTEPATRQVMLAGFIYAPFRANDLLEGIMGHERHTAGIAFDVFDGETAKPDALLHHYEPAGVTVDPNEKPQFVKTVSVDVPQRTWTLVYRSTAGFERNSTRGYTLLVLAAGGVTSMLLFALSAAQASATQRAQRAADEARRTESLLRASESKFRRLADANLVGVAFTKADGTVLQVNDEICRILGRPRQEVESEDFKWHDVTPPEGVQADRRAIAQLRSTTICAPYEKEYVRPDGSHVPVLLGIAQLENAEHDCVALIVDLTTRKQAERDLIAAKETAERALAEAEQASRLKDEFLATVSHELRTPLNAILGWAQLLGRGRERTSNDLEHGLATIERSARAQSQLIDDLLDVSRIVAGKLRLDVQVIQPIHVIEAAIASVHPAADAKGVRLVHALDPHAGPVSADPNRLQQIVWNLLVNAVKFTPKDGVVQVTLKRDAADADQVQIIVTDTGIGIPAEFLPYVFDRFRQADSSTTRRYGGLGLGLAIVRHLVELHGGTVTVDSRGAGSGSAFTVSLPVATGAAASRGIDAAPSTAASNGVSLAGVRVLLVEDDPDARELITRVLHDHGATVTSTASATEAIDNFAAVRPDVLVSDIGMPDEDGYSLIARIRALPDDAGGHVPAIALTALARPEDRRRAIMAGYQVHLAKPVEAAELSATIANLIDGKRDRERSTTA
jgi:PAS domain S-box-containing protein